MPQFPSVAIPQRLPLILQSESRDDTSLKDAKLVNGFVERGTAEGETWIIKRPGIRQTGDTKSGDGLGVYNWRGDVYAIFGSVLYRNGTSVGTGINTTGGSYRFSSSLGSTPRLQFGNGAIAYNYDNNNGLSAISGANFPLGFRKGWAYINGTTYVLDTSAKLYGCTTANTPTDWSDILNVLTAQIEPDAGVALAKQLVYAVVLKEWSTEFFFDAGNPSGSPLKAAESLKLSFGCANQDSVQEFDGNLFWVSTNRSSSAQVLKLENLKPLIVSTKPVERILNGADLTSVASFTVKHDGHKFYGISLLNDNITLVYDAAENLWAQWTDADGNYFPIVSASYSASLGKILQHRTNGKLYTLDAGYTDDDGDTITVDLITPNFDGGVRRRKQMNVLKFLGDQTPGSILQVRTNDHDYDSTKWTNFRKVYMGLKEPMLTRCGSFVRRAHHIRHQCDTKMRLQAVEMQIDVGTL